MVKQEKQEKPKEPAQYKKRALGIKFMSS